VTPTSSRFDDGGQSGAISYATNAIICERTKHIDSVRCLFVKDHVEAGTVRVQYIATDLNTADMMTTPLPHLALAKHARSAMGWWTCSQEHSEPSDDSARFLW